MNITQEKVDNLNTIVKININPEDYQPRIRQLIEEGLACPGPEYAECKQHQGRLTPGNDGPPARRRHSHHAGNHLAGA